VVKEPGFRVLEVARIDHDLIGGIPDVPGPALGLAEAGEQGARHV
jgi:hypothetical protein